MKSKFSKILGVALPLVMILALALAMVPARAPTVEAAATALRFNNVSIPKIGEDGRYVLNPNTDIGAIAIDASGGVMYAADTSSLTATTVNTTTATSTDIPVVSVAGFRASGVVTIGTELIRYT